uniref:polysaccharide biosynthesis protein n=1 Tax=Daejeonella sp. TaxID=2805397 RepID=UPI00404AA0BE
MFSILITNSAFFILNLVLFSFNQAPYISNVILVINGLTGFLLLITYRVVVKYFFMYVKNFRIDQHRVIIYGAGEGGIAAKRTLDHDIKINMLITAFIDDDERKTGKAIDGIKIYHTREFQNLINNDKIDDLIIASQNIPPDQKNKIVDLCLENQIKVLTLPPVQSWINGQLSSRQLQTIKIEDLLEREPIEINNGIIGDQIKGKRILVTGAAGSIGSEIVRQISLFHPQMIILNDQSESPLHELHLELQENN